MSITTEFRRTVDEARATLADPKPLHAVAGAGDLLVERVRTAAAAQQRAMQSVRFDTSAVPALVSATIDNIRGAIVGFPDRAEAVVFETVVQASHTYDDLAKRGATLVQRVRRQQASQDLGNQVANTVRATKAATTTARKATATTTSRAKAAATSARKTATAAGAAVTAATAKTGSTTTPRTRTTSAARTATTSTKKVTVKKVTAKKVAPKKTTARKTTAKTAQSA